LGQGAREATWTAKTLWWAGGDVRIARACGQFWQVLAGAGALTNVVTVQERERERERETGRCVLQRLSASSICLQLGGRQSATPAWLCRRKLAACGTEAFLRVTGRQVNESLVVHDSRAGGQKPTAAGDAGGSLRVKYSRLEQRSAAQREGQVKCVGNLCTASTIPCTAFCMRSGLRDFHYHYLRYVTPVFASRPLSTCLALAAAHGSPTLC